MKNVQHKLLDLFVAPHMAFSIKLHILKALDQTMYFSDGVKWCIGSHPDQDARSQQATCYQRVLDSMLKKQVRRAAIAAQMSAVFGQLEKPLSCLPFHGMDPLSYFSFQPVLHDWCNKDRICAILSGMVHIKEPLLLIRKSSPCGGSGFPLAI